MEDFNNLNDTNFGNHQVNDPVLTQDEKMWAMFAHLSALIGLVIPFGNIIGPLLIWILKKEESDFVNRQGKESINFQISITIYSLVAIVLVLLLIGLALLVLVGLFAVIMVIIASMNAYDGKDYRYPLTIRFVK